MLRKSIAYAELLQRSQRALGRERLYRDYGISELIATHAASFGPVSATTFEADIRESDFQRAMVSDVEAVYDRCLAQALAYGYLLTGKVDPSWTAVTGYYAAFFAVRLLNAVLGTGSRRLPVLGAITPGLYRFSAGPSVYSGRVVLRLRKEGGNSHQVVWRAFATDLDALSALSGLDNRSKTVLASLAPAIRQPGLPSDFRNQVNYGLEDAWSRPAWATFLLDVGSTDVETLILRSTALADEQRVELALLSAVSLSVNLYSDYLATANRPDKRRGANRRVILDSALSGVVGDGLRKVFRGN